MGLRPRAFIGDRGVEGGKIDHANRLGAEHERIIADAVAVELGLDRQRADAVETALGIGVDAAVEEPRGDDVARILQAAPQRVDAARAVVEVPRRPIILRSRAAADVAGDDVAASPLLPIGGSVIGSSSTSVFGCRPACNAAR